MMYRYVYINTVSGAKVMSNEFINHPNLKLVSEYRSKNFNDYNKKKWMLKDIQTKQK